MFDFFFWLLLAFYLIMDVAVGGTNGWFPDGPEKPWLNASPSKSPDCGNSSLSVSDRAPFLAAMRDFLMAQDKWYPTWPQNVEDRAFVMYVFFLVPRRFYQSQPM